MTENWYELYYDDQERGGETLDIVVLITSQEGLETLAREFESIAKIRQPGRYELRIDSEGSDESLLFTHVEIAHKLPKEIPEKVLYLSPEGLDFLVSEFNEIAKIKRFGRYELHLNKLDCELKVLFTHVEIGTKSEELDDDSSDLSSGCQTIVWGMIIVFGLALYGLINIIGNLFS